MPPGPAYNFLCVAHSVFRVLNNVAEIRASQLAGNASPRRSQLVKTRRTEPAKGRGDVEQLSRMVINSRQAAEELSVQREEDASVASRAELVQPAQDSKLRQEAPLPSEHPIADVQSAIPEDALPVASVPAAYAVQDELPPDIISSSPQNRTQPAAVIGIPGRSPAPQPQPASHEEPADSEPAFPIPIPNRKLQSSKVPSSRIGRLFHYGGMKQLFVHVFTTHLTRIFGRSCCVTRIRCGN